MRGVAAVLEQQLGDGAARRRVRVEHRARLRHHRLGRRDLRARPSRDRAQRPELVEVEERGVRHDHVGVRCPQRRPGECGVDLGLLGGGEPLVVGLVLIGLLLQLRLLLLQLGERCLRLGRGLVCGGLGGVGLGLRGRDGGDHALDVRGDHVQRGHLVDQVAKGFGRGIE